MGPISVAANETSAVVRPERFSGRMSRIRPSLAWLTLLVPICLVFATRAFTQQVAGDEAERLRTLSADGEALERRLAYRLNTIAAGERQIVALRNELEKQQAAEEPNELEISRLALGMFMVEARMEADRIHVWQTRALQELPEGSDRTTDAWTESTRRYVDGLAAERRRARAAVDALVTRYSPYITDPRVREEFTIRQQEGSR